MRFIKITNILQEFSEQRLTSENSPSKIIKIQNKIDKFYGYMNEDKNLDLQDSIYFLAKLIHKYLQRKVFVIIDEFDAPLKTLNRGSKEYQNAKDNTQWHVFRSI